jgi:SAM-dependent methyltransferase
MFEPLLEDVFSRDDARVRAILRELRGEVLDLGCGEGPYEEILGPLAESGAIRYLGVDPDPDAIAGLQDRWAWAELSCSGGEELELGERSFDHLLILRSWNHLRDPSSVLARLIPRIRPGGTLTIVDNVAFGLARTRAQTRRGERSRSGLEHFRNDTLADAAEVVAPFVGVHGMQEIVREEVRPTTSNQWLLRYRVGTSSVDTEEPEG